MRWTHKRIVEVEAVLNQLAGKFPEWEQAVAKEVLDHFHCRYCTSQMSVEIEPVAYLKWIVVYFVCPNCGNIRLKSINDIDGLHVSTGVKTAPNVFYRIFHTFSRSNPITISRNYLRSQAGRGRPAIYNLRRVDAEIYKTARPSGIYRVAKYGWDVNLIAEKVNREWKRKYSRRLVYARLIDMEVRGLFWKTTRYGKWFFKMLFDPDPYPVLYEMGLKASDKLGAQAVDIDDNLIAERDNILKSKRQEFNGWRELETRNKALIESLNFA